MRIPDWTTFRAEDGTNPCGACCLMERVFDLSNLPRNYIWTLGFLGEWPEHPEQAEISAQVKSYSRQWLVERAEVMKQKQEQAEELRQQVALLSMQRAREDGAVDEKQHTDVAGLQRRIEAGPMAMAKGILKSAADLATGGVADPAGRMEICQKCPFMGDDKRCGKCGCFLPAKTRIAKSSCPIGLW